MQLSSQNSLFIVDSSIFQSTVNKNHPTIKLIKQASENGVGIELEEYHDCASGQFHRTGDVLFDNIFITEGSSRIWPQDLLNLEMKLGVEGKVTDLRGFDYDEALSKVVEHAPVSSCLEDGRRAEFSNSLNNDGLIMNEMLMKVILFSEVQNPEDLVLSILNHPGKEDLLSRISPLLGIGKNSDEPGHNHSGSTVPEEGDWLMDLALKQSTLSQEDLDEILKDGLNKEGIRRIIKCCKSGISIRILLVADSERLSMPMNELAALFRTHMSDDLEILEHWTEIEPDNPDSWEIRTRALWNMNEYRLCYEISKQGLEFHPEHVDLLRRKAHGLREDGEHEEAIQIELRLLDSPRLARLDTLIYLCRSLLFVERWNELLRYSTAGLELNAEHAELKNHMMTAIENGGDL